MTDQAMSKLHVGDKIKFDSEKQRYTIQAFDNRYFILTKPFNAKKTYLYTIVDLDRKVRGPCNLVFGLPEDCDTPEGAELNLKYLNGYDDGSGMLEMEVSYRRFLPLSENELRIFGAKQ